MRSPNSGRTPLKYAALWLNPLTAINALGLLSHHLGLSKASDLFRSKSKLCQHLIGLFAEFRGAPCCSVCAYISPAGRPGGSTQPSNSANGKKARADARALTWGKKDQQIARRSGR